VVTCRDRQAVAVGAQTAHRRCGRRGHGRGNRVRPMTRDERPRTRSDCGEGLFHRRPGA
jgi:hypothetical protein